MAKFLKSLVVGEEGATMVEYALMVALIAAALVAVVGTLATAISTNFTTVANKISATS